MRPLVSLNTKTQFPRQTEASLSTRLAYSFFFHLCKSFIAVLYWCSIKYNTKADNVYNSHNNWRTVKRNNLRSKRFISVINNKYHARVPYNNRALSLHDTLRYIVAGCKTPPDIFLFYNFILYKKICYFSRKFIHILTSSSFYQCSRPTIIFQVSGTLYRFLAHFTSAHTYEL